jgi:hypothetical protein
MKNPGVESDMSKRRGCYQTCCRVEMSISVRKNSDVAMNMEGRTYSLTHNYLSCSNGVLENPVATSQINSSQKRTPI